MDIGFKLSSGMCNSFQDRSDWQIIIVPKQSDIPSIQSRILYVFKKKKQVGAVIGLIFFNPVSNRSKFFSPQQFEN